MEKKKKYYYKYSTGFLFSQKLREMGLSPQQAAERILAGELRINKEEKGKIRMDYRSKTYKPLHVEVLFERDQLTYFSLCERKEVPQFKEKGKKDESTVSPSNELHAAG